MTNRDFWNGKKVFVTGHTGFKGSWLCLWLSKMGAEITGYSLQPATTPSLFELCNINSLLENHILADIRDAKQLNAAMEHAQPEIVIHMAAQPLVRESYRNPIETYEVNVMGTVNLMEAIRNCESVIAVVNVTTDKCYDNKEWHWGYRENEPLGGHDPYSSSKACSELVTGAYRSSFLNSQIDGRAIAVASARAGNVIGGGDWAADRLVPDIVRSIVDGQKIIIRNPNSIRPWQHVLEPLSGYLLLAEKLYQNGEEYASAWNFGPSDEDAKPVEWIVQRICQKWPGAIYDVDNASHPHEAQYLKLDCSKAKAELNWRSRWDLDHTLEKIMEWTRCYNNGESMYEITFSQIEEYENSI
ncbi:CDP-glucose 4,6-dehydratase [Paenibacillus sp. P3E]|uniref:CDP-glucose 4,6-dehydratase n=1 Tax=Paenibacillus sp. P3E TaxID=1349435 RepID=UPI000939256D|nr:CDP-glucose 4,6-dehydratase [Paenibacillus sp. P3E]OKP86558.1 CDP-glucose 4,6-dehydratase [Paenibacillus sp. P3E]